MSSSSVCIVVYLACIGLATSRRINGIMANIIRSDLDKFNQSRDSSPDSAGPSRESVKPHCERASNSWTYAWHLKSTHSIDTDYWVTSEKEVYYAESKVHRTTSEFKKLRDYFYRYMPEDTELMKITRLENRQTWPLYVAYRDLIHMNTMDSYPCSQEMWLWHGASDANRLSIQMDGFKVAYSSMKYNVYGAGLYFAPDPRMAHNFLPEAKGNEGAIATLILTRVVAGKVGERKPLCWSGCSEEKWRTLLGDPANRQAPTGYHSATSPQGIEVVTYQDSSAYAAYVFQYRAPSLANIDPYINKGVQISHLATHLDTHHVDPFCACPSSYKNQKEA